MAGYGTTVYETGSGYGQTVHLTGAGYGDPIFISSANAGGTAIFISSANAGGKAVYKTGCFPKSELIHTGLDEYIPIGSIKLGDKIASWDSESGKMQHTIVTNIHQYTVNEIICFNNTMHTSSSHPLLVIDQFVEGFPVSKWKVAYDVCVGDCVVSPNGKHITIKSKQRYWYNLGTDVLNLSTDNGVPFFVGGCAVRANNAKDIIEWSNTPVTQKLISIQKPSAA